MPANAGIQESGYHQLVWIPACAGMTVALYLNQHHSIQLRRVA